MRTKRIKTFSRIHHLARSGRSVWRRQNWGAWRKIPAAFVQNWPGAFLQRSIQFGDLREVL